MSRDPWRYDMTSALEVFNRKPRPVEPYLTRIRIHRGKGKTEMVILKKGKLYHAVIERIPDHPKGHGQLVRYEQVPEPLHSKLIDMICRFQIAFDLES
jgi:hypothetical protein